ncbi:hypothetical protein AB0C76_30640 [Kitasatospora sp. NPDC048722]|uniref:hypothetical protein n=1 Tax=Kitasatospora sp. NPDC048722 TaxID=3155639 RepID=UPI0033FAC4CF
MLHALVVLEGRPVEREGRVPLCEVVESSRSVPAEVLKDRRPAAFVLGEHME